MKFPAISNVLPIVVSSIQRCIKQRVIKRVSRVSAIRVAKKTAIRYVFFLSRMLKVESWEKNSPVVFVEIGNHGLIWAMN